MDIAYVAGLPGKEDCSRLQLLACAELHSSIWRETDFTLQMLLCRPTRSAADDASVLPRHPRPLRHSRFLGHLRCFSWPKHWRRACTAPRGGRHTLFRRSCCALSARLAADSLTHVYCLCSWLARKDACVFSFLSMLSQPSASEEREREREIYRFTLQMPGAASAMTGSCRRIDVASAGLDALEA